MSVLKSKMFWLGLFLLALGTLFGAIEKTFYQYIDENGFLHESWFLPIGVLCLLLGGSITAFAIIAPGWSFLKKRGEMRSNEKRGPAQL